MKLREVLVVDDSDSDLFYAEIVLGRADIAERVVPFGTAIEALAFLQGPEGRRAEVVLLDINMPEMDGFEFLEQFQKLHDAQQTGAVVVVLTSSPDPGDQERAESFRCVKGYVVKPLDVPTAQRLVDVVDRPVGAPR